VTSAGLGAWVNYNPESNFHLLGRLHQRRDGSLSYAALCGITVRDNTGVEWSRTHPRACPECLEAEARGWDIDEARAAFRARRAEKPLRGFGCKR
jgi:hypothetical protein